MSEERDPDRDQVAPTHTTEEYTQEQVIDDVRERMEPAWERGLVASRES